MEQRVHLHVTVEVQPPLHANYTDRRPIGRGTRQRFERMTSHADVVAIQMAPELTDENLGRFLCIPELIRSYDTLKLTQPADRDRFTPDITGFDCLKVKIEAGDLVIFSNSEPHGIRPNRSGDKVRPAQYIWMSPAQKEHEAIRQWRIASWRDRQAPEGHAFPGDPRNWERTPYETAVLTKRGEKLPGMR